MRSFAIVGLDAEPVTVEVDLSQGLPGMTIVGLPDKAVEEAKERVRSAISNSGAKYPLRRITVNLAPADLKKVGPAYDLPIALGILSSDEQVEVHLPSNAAIIGELALNGAVRPVRGVLSIALSAVKRGAQILFVPEENAPEAALVLDITIYPLASLRQLLDHIAGTALIQPFERRPLLAESSPSSVDFAEIKGQVQAKRALEIAAAGGHNVLMSGPPGSGKTLLAKALPSILPPLAREEMLEVTRVHSVAGVLDRAAGLVTQRPIRTPHHTASAISLIGGGAWPRPGEISLAHRGVLFLDELPEFPRSVLEVLRQPLEDGVITVSRAAHSLSFPAKFMLIAAQNPCPCGHLGTARCVCSAHQIQRYQRKVSGPLLDRIDLHVHVPKVELEDLKSRSDSESSAAIRDRIIAARAIQSERFGSAQTNSEMSNRTLKRHCAVTDDAERVLSQAVKHFDLSARSYYRILKLARTIADLANVATIDTPQIAEAIQYRPQRHEG